MWTYGSGESGGWAQMRLHCSDYVLSGYSDVWMWAWSGESTSWNMADCRWTQAGSILSSNNVSRSLNYCDPWSCLWWGKWQKLAHGSLVVDESVFYIVLCAVFGKQRSLVCLFTTNLKSIQLKIGWYSSDETLAYLMIRCGSFVVLVYIEHLAIHDALGSILSIYNCGCACSGTHEVDAGELEFKTLLNYTTSSRPA